jgi:hypothetical protein
MDPELIAQWKKEYTDIYVIALEDVEFYYRALTLQEIEDIDILTDTDDSSSAEAEDWYVKVGVLYPTEMDLDDYLPGTISALATSILQISGLTDATFIVNSLEEERDKIQTDVIDMMKAFIITAMPTYTEEGLNALTVKEMIKKVIFAEQIFNLKQTINGIESSGVTFTIKLKGEEEAKPESPRAKATRRMDVNREELLRRIRADERGMVDATKMVDPEQLNKFDDELLVKASGVVDPEDPIARKLRMAMGG